MFSDSRKDDNYYIEIADEDGSKQNDEIVPDQKPLDELTSDKASKETNQKIPEGANYLEQLQRLQAEFINYKKRVEKEKLELSDIFRSELVSFLLPVLDDFERMLNHPDQEDNELLKGVRLIYQKLFDILEAQGLVPIDSMGQKFDPKLHEAVLIEHSNNGDNGTIVEEWRKGYLFHDRLLRPAQVKVLKTEKVIEN